ncbi:SNF2-related protein [Aquihabitans daechungensis]|uniref:SNF2-related protein n=1 Tax=Aquihabitans daechungensis TaxID=1052257 RepID=UPI003BA15120
MSAPRSLLEQPGLEAIFVPGRPARTGRLALWHPGHAPEAFTETIDVVMPAGDTVRQRTVPATFVALAAVFDDLVALDPDAPCGASIHDWAGAARGALHLIARGRLLPAVDEEGVDGWRIGPLDPEDLAARDVIADALAPAGHATALAGTAPRRVSSPRWLVARFWDAIADSYVRTAAAPLVAGHEAFAARPRVDLVPAGGGGGPALLGLDLATATWGGSTTVPGWLQSTSSSAEADITVALRLEDAGGITTARAQRPSTPEPEAGDEADAYAETEPDGEPLHDLADALTFRAVLEIGSVADRSLVLDAVDLWAAPHAVAERFGASVEDAVLLTLRRGARAWQPLGRLLDEARPSELELTGEEVEDLLGPVATDLAGAGIEVRWPAGVLQAVDLKPVVASDALGADRPAGMSFDTLCELRWDATIDGQQVSEDELALLVQAKRGVVRLRGRWVRADPAKLARLQQRRKVTAGEALAAALSGELVVDGEEVAAEVQGPLAQLGERLRSVGDRREWTVPSGLDAELRPYQRDGAAWLVEMADLGLGGVLADDMGLGKTIQFLALHLARHQPDTDGGGQPTLVVCPVSVLSNWARETHRFAPGVPILRYHGAARSLDGLRPDTIVLTTYGVARREAAALAAHPWGLIAADEAQAIKNPISRTAKALRTIPADARFALTGTPVENRLVDLWALLDWTTPGLLGPLDRFRREIAVPVERDRDPDAAESLARLVRPFLLRRRKSDPDIAPDLPPKTETDRVVPLTTEQVTLYKATVDEVMAQVEAAEGMSRRGLVLKLLTGLKQICNHPAQFLKQDGPVAGRSGKLEAVTELVETITAEGESVLVFTQFVAMGHLLETHLAAPDRPVQFLYGGTPEARRGEMVDRFQAGEVPVFVISVKAGGTGLNLTQATHVIHYDRWWNPAVEDQASDRAWRIGQDRPVQVHRMVCEGTVEDRISAMLADKRAIAESVVTSGEGWVSELGDDDLRLLVALGAETDDEPIPRSR